MPTTTIECPLDEPRFQRRVAKQLSFWWRAQGVDINHAITRFVAASGQRVFSGPFPLGEPAFAFVTCVVAQDRDRAFRQRYADVVRAALGPEISPDRIFVSVQPTDPADHFPPVPLVRRERTGAPK